MTIQDLAHTDSLELLALSGEQEPVALITDPNTIGQDAFDAGFEGRESDCMPSCYADEGDNWRIWADNYQAGERDARSDAMEFLADAQSPDATGQNQWRQDEAVDNDYGYHSQFNSDWEWGPTKPLELNSKRAARFKLKKLYFICDYPWLFLFFIAEYIYV